MPLAFCRECGQEYHPVRAFPDDTASSLEFQPRTLSDIHGDGQSEAGFLFFSSTEPWPSEAEDSFWNRLPSDWQEEHRGYPRIRKDRRKHLPRPVTVGPNGREADGADCFEGTYLPAPFKFCLSCGISYSANLRSDFTKLASLGSEGRSTATTILSLSAISGLKEEDLKPEARKILSFTDNRQDASLQAGHFNDFVEIGLLRSALYRQPARVGKRASPTTSSRAASLRPRISPLSGTLATPRHVSRREPTPTLRRPGR
jgi:hypothetical protein